MTFIEYLKAKGMLADYEAIRSNIAEYEADIASIDFEQQPGLLQEIRHELTACREALESYYKDYRKGK